MFYYVCSVAPNISEIASLPDAPGGSRRLVNVVVQEELRRRAFRVLELRLNNSDTEDSLICWLGMAPSL